jgi:hypothetical protein
MSGTTKLARASKISPSLCAAHCWRWLTWRKSKSASIGSANGTHALAEAEKLLPKMGRGARKQARPKRSPYVAVGLR